MSETLQTSTGAPGAASPSAGASDGSAPGTGTPAAGGGSAAAGSATAAAPAPAQPKQPPLSRAARAAEKAATKLAAGKGGPSNTPSTTDGQQAPGAEHRPGVSTEQTGGDGKAGADTKPADGEGAGKGAAPASTELTAPQDWPHERQEAFNKLPPEGRKIALDFHKEMHSAFTRSMTQLAEQSKTHQEAITIGQKFQADPKATIAELAKRAGVEIFFERPTAEDVPPDEVLNDPKKYAQWIADKARRDARAELETEARQRETHQREEETRAAVAKAGETLQQEFAEAAKAHADFADHKPKVVAILQRAQGGLTTEEAYQLATYDAMVKRVNEGETAKRELATLKADLERKAKDATRLPAGGAAPGAASGEDKFLSPGARAFNKATARRQARTATR